MKTHAHIRKVAERYNMVPNVVWTVLNLTPVFIFCYTAIPPEQIGWVLLLSAIAAFLPSHWYKWMQLGNDAAAYRKAGILLIRKYSQDGDFINKLLRRKFPHYKVIRSASEHQRYIQRANMFERFHVAAMAAMLAFAVYALYLQQHAWALVITLNNILYNVYPVWLQQYNRLRLRGIMKRKP